MALLIGDNFNYQGLKPNFERDRFLTLAEMKAYPETSLDDGHLSYCAEDGKRYEFKSTNSVDETTGKWREFKAGADTVSWNDVTNKPEILGADEEDLTKSGNVLKFKDKEYDAENFSGLGRVYLRKNIQQVTIPKFDLTISTGCTTDGNITINETPIAVTTEASTPEAVAQLIQAAISGTTISEAVVTFTSNPTVDYSTTGVSGLVVDNSYLESKNILTQDMINQPNTIYEVRYDYDLNGGPIHIRENSIIDFEGGSINNGTIIFYKNAKIINDNFINCYFQQTNDNVIPFTKGILFASEENLRNTNNVRLKDIVYLKTNYGIKPYEINISDQYQDEGSIKLINYNNISAVPLKETLSNGIINVTKYGIYPNGEDMSDKLNDFLSSDMQWYYKFSTLYFPGGVYKFNKPIKFNQRCNIIGDIVSIYGNEITGTIFDFSDIINNEPESELWCVTANQQLYTVQNICFKSNSYNLVEDRNKILYQHENPWTETINQKNICGINAASNIDRCYFIGFSGTAIYRVFGNFTNLYFTKCNLCINAMGDSTIDNIRAYACNDIIRTLSLGTVTNVRGDSIKGNVFAEINSTCANNIIIDWGYSSIYKIKVYETAGINGANFGNITHNIYRNIVNPALINETSLDNIVVNNNIGVVYIFNESQDVKDATIKGDINITGEFRKNIKDGEINHESDKITTLSIPIVIDINNLNGIYEGSINIDLYDININDIIEDVTLLKQFIYINSGTFSCDDVILNGQHFIIKNLTKDTYDNSHIVYIGNNCIPPKGTNRPTNVNIGFQYFDITLNKPIWWNGTEWIESGDSLPEGGTIGQVLTKTNDGYDWQDVQAGSSFPEGGTVGQVLKKTESGTEWANDNNTTYENASQSSAGLMSSADKTKLDNLVEIPNGGTVGQVLKKTSTGVEWGNDSDTIVTVNNTLESDSTTEALSAAQGKALNEKIEALEIPEEYTLPTATSSQLGGVKIGEGITVQSDGTISAADDVVSLTNLYAAKGDIALMCAVGPFITNLYFIKSPANGDTGSAANTGDYYHLCVMKSGTSNYLETTCSNVADTFSSFDNIDNYFVITNTVLYLKNNVIYHVTGGTDAGYFVSNERGDTLTNVASRFETLAEARAFMREKMLALPGIGIVKCTSEEYEDSVKDENTLYIIHG